MPLDDFDTHQLRQVLGSFVTGVTVITTVDEMGLPYGLTANSFTSVSLDPPLVLWNQSLSAPSHGAFRDAPRFAVNILAEHQVAVSQRFARPSADKFEGIPTTPGLGGIPLLDGCAAHLECRKVATHTGGDHAVFIGQVERIDSSGHKSLVFGGGRYMVAHAHDLGEVSDDDTDLRQVQAVRLATPVLCDLAAELSESLALSIWTPQGPSVVRWEPSRNPASTRLRMGTVSVLGSATGRLFAACLPRELTAAALAAEDAGSAAHPTVDAMLHEIRQLGHSIIERPPSGPGDPTLRAISVPVLDARGVVVLAITALRRPDAKPGEAALMEQLKATAQTLSQRLGHRG